MLYVGTHALRAYIDEFNNVRVRFSHSNTDSSASGDVTLSGYYVDLQ